MGGHSCPRERRVSCRIPRDRQYSAPRTERKIARAQLMIDDQQLEGGGRNVAGSHGPAFHRMEVGRRPRGAQRNQHSHQP